MLKKGENSLQKAIKCFAAFMFAVALSVMGTVAYASYKIPETMYVEDINKLQLNLSLPITHTDNVPNKAKLVDTNPNAKEKHTVIFKLFGIIPIEKTRVTVAPAKKVKVLGMPFGIKLYTDGVLVVNITEFDTIGGTACPAKDCGIKKGDYILTVNGIKVYSNTDIEKIVKDNGSKSINIEYYRGNKKHTATIKPQISATDRCYHLGMWLRDSSAGIGTLTFYDSETGVMAGLGHALCDSDTGKRLSVSRGSIVPAEILSVTKSKSGYAGELSGRFIKGEFSKVLLNSENGIYAMCKKEINGIQTVEVCNKQNVKKGAAQILVTLNGTTPKFYGCKIKSVSYKSGETRNMVVEITDNKLLSQTGGIVQGMSGSPLLQNGKLIGAVTHVLVDDPTKGYAIFAENMLETAQSVASEQLKEAS